MNSRIKIFKRGVTSTKHLAIAHRRAVVHQANSDEKADTGSMAYVVTQIDVEGLRAFGLNSFIGSPRNGAPTRVSILRPPDTPLNRLFAWLGARWLRPVLAGEDQYIPPKIPFMQRLTLRGLRYVLLAVLCLFAYGYWQQSHDEPLIELLYSRYAVAVGLLCAVYLWLKVKAHLHDLLNERTANGTLRFAVLRAIPKAFGSGSTSVKLGSTTFRVVECTVSSAVLWLVAGPIIGDSQTGPSLNIRFEGGARVFHVHADPGTDWQPFLVAGDQMRVAVHDRDDGDLDVFAYANLTDGHTYVSRSSQIVFPSDFALLSSGLLAVLFLVCLPSLWLGVGTKVDSVSEVLLAISLALTILIGFSVGASRTRRARLAKALGTTLREFDARRVEVDIRLAILNSEDVPSENEEGDGNGAAFKVSAFPTQQE